LLLRQLEPLILDSMETSKIETGNQASIPPDVRAALGLRPGDTISWTIANGEVKVAKADAADVGFDSALVPTPDDFDVEGGAAAMRALSEEERLALLQREIEAGRASGVSDRSLDDIRKAHRAARG
jgi:bifunctional DNA-binding transcriptional regulator/antitoxin component of YhaV-PrlF toxin-antitoxin module